MGSLSNNGVLFNEAVFKAVLHDLGKETKGSAGQPQIIIGAPGGGKTFMLRQLFDTASAHSGVVPTWIDGRTVFSNKDMLCMPDKGRSVLFVDDFHYYLQRTSNEEQFALRGILSETDGPILVATAPTVMPQLTHYGAALFEGFHIHYLKPLSDNDYRLIIGCDVTQIKRAKALMAYLPKTPGAVDMVKEIVYNSPTSEEDLSLLVKRISPLYQNIFDKLLPQQQRVMCALAGETEGLKLSDIRNITGQEAGKISPYITRMLENGLISKETQSTRGAHYRINDPLFNLWLPKRNDHCGNK